MIITTISDLHGEFPVLPGGDVLIIAGDCTSNDTVPAWNDFYDWLDNQKYRKIFIVAGNHDNFLKSACKSDDSILEFLEQEGEGVDRNISYLCDSGEKFEGVYFWGSPWTLWFRGINPHCKAFTGREGDLSDKFDAIPDCVDVLITHSPPFGILDQVLDYHTGSVRNCGSSSLLQNIHRVKPKYHVFGHIHEHGGKSVVIKHPEFDAGNNTNCVNVSQVDESYIFRPCPYSFVIQSS